MLKCKRCQCPKRAFLISTQRGTRQGCRHAKWCQCPKRAFLISTFPAKIYAPKVTACQCPKRAFLISTVPSGNPCKHWLSSLIFAGICQTILKTAVFLQFFGLFIICSYFSVLISSFHTPIILQSSRIENPFPYIQKCNTAPWIFRFPIHIFFCYTVISI